MELTHELPQLSDLPAVSNRVVPDLDVVLCAEGVLYAEKDFNLKKHPEIDVPNLQVIKLMQSFRSKELVTERFAWRHYYWCVNCPCSDCVTRFCRLRPSVSEVMVSFRWGRDLCVCNTETPRCVLGIATVRFLPLRLRNANDE